MPQETDQEVSEPVSPKVKLFKDGRLTQNMDGAEVTVATYSRTTGHLEFETKEYAEKLYQQVTAKIGTVAKGTQPSGLIIRSFGVKGQKSTLAKNAPKRPKFGELGDCTPEVVEWYFKYNPTEAFIRYGVFTDKKGEAIRKDVRREVVSTFDQRNTHDDSELEWTKDGNKSRVKVPVGLEREVISLSDQIIARRSTHMTFTIQEVVGGYTPEDDEDIPQIEGDDQ